MSNVWVLVWTSKASTTSLVVRVFEAKPVEAQEVAAEVGRRWVRTAPTVWETEGAKLRLSEHEVVKVAPERKAE